MSHTPASPLSQPVWDRFVRFFHWALVGCVLLNYFVLEPGEWQHRWVGYLATALVTARIVWGFVGSRHARFADFFPTPVRLKHHVEALLAQRADAHAGHNPLGALMMLMLMALVLLLGLTGWLQGTDAYFGNEGLQDLHRYLGNALVLSAGLHAASAILVGRLERTRLIKAMVTGVKEHY